MHVQRPVGNPPRHDPIKWPDRLLQKLMRVTSTDATRSSPMNTLENEPAIKNSNSWLTVATFDFLKESQELAHFLSQEGMPSKIQDERKLQKSWFWAKPIAGIHVQVPESSFEQVQHCLETSPLAKQLLHRATRCPSCNSVRVHYPQMTRKNVLPTLVAQILVMAGVMKREYYCENCHHTWMPTGRAGDLKSIKRPNENEPL